MAMHTPAARLHHQGGRGRPHHPTVQRRIEVRAGQLPRRVCVVQPITRQPRTRTTTTATPRIPLVTRVMTNVLVMLIVVNSVLVVMLVG